MLRTRLFAVLVAAVSSTAFAGEPNSSAATGDDPPTGAFLVAANKAQLSSLELHCASPDTNRRLVCRATRVTVRRDQAGECRVSQLAGELVFERSGPVWTMQVSGKLCTHTAEAWTLQRRGGGWEVLRRDVELRPPATGVERQCKRQEDDLFVPAQPATDFGCKRVVMAIL